MINLWRDCWNVSQGSTPSSILPAGFGWSSDSQASTCYFSCGYNFGHLSRCELVSHCVLICIPLRTRRVEHLFTNELVIFRCFLETSTWGLYSISVYLVFLAIIKL